MSQIFVSIFNLSIAASWLIGAVLLLRLLLKNKAPKWISCLLWAVVGLRLVIPFYFESNISLVPSRDTLNPEAVYGESAPAESQPADDAFQSNAPVLDTSAVVPPAVDGVDEALPDTENKKPTEYIHSGFDSFDERVNEALNEADTQAVADTQTEPEAVNPVRRFADIASIVWLCGIAAMVIYAVINYAVLKRRVAVFVPEEGNIRRSENVGSPFILGFIFPKIYLPFGLSSETEKHIIAHERAHLKRRDHWIKPLGYAILTVYWFNPLVWLAYILLCRDIEYACDEKVVKNLDAEARKAYASALLECGVKRSFVSACPVAFGEIGVKDRVKNALSYKKPLLWIIIAAVVICAVTAIAFFAVPKDGEDESSGTSSEITDETSADISDDISDEIPGDISDETPGDISDEVSNDVSDGNGDENPSLVTENINYTKHVFSALLNDPSFAAGETPRYIIDSKEKFETLCGRLSQTPAEFKNFADGISGDYFDNNALIVVYVITSNPAEKYEIDHLYKDATGVTIEVSYHLPSGSLPDASESVVVFAEVKKDDVKDISAIKATVKKVAPAAPVVWDGSCASGFASGDGSKNSPYLIETPAQLAYLSKSVNEGNDYSGKYIALNGDIYLNEPGSNWTDSAREWTAIGYMKVKAYEIDSAVFSGSFDGRHHMVSGLYIDEDSSYQGLFGYTVRGEIKNILVEGNIKSTGECIGGIVGQAIGTNFYFCSNGVKISGGNLTGGIVGTLIRGNIENCYNYSNVSGVNKVGGIVGSFSGDEDPNLLKGCYSIGTITATNESAGGIAGVCSGAVTTQNYNSGSINGNLFVGGVIGQGNMELTDCYNTGAVSGVCCVGGVIGLGAINNKAVHCFNKGKVTGVDGVGGVMGAVLHSTEIKQCYYLKDGELAGVGGIWNKNDGSDGEVTSYDNKSGEADSLTELQMTQQESFVGFDFDSIWKMSKRNPIFK